MDTAEKKLLQYKKKKNVPNPFVEWLTNIRIFDRSFIVFNFTDI